MRRPEPLPRARGFSRVEMLVALVFTSLLMAGMAAVFKGSLGNYRTAAETLSGLRQGQLATDLLAEDLVSAGMTPNSLTAAPIVPFPISTTNPAFAITPNVSYGSTDEPTHLGDQLFLYYERILPYQCKLASAVPSAAQIIAGATKATAATLTFNDADQATVAAADVTAAIAAGQTVMVFFQSTGLGLPLTTLTSSGTAGTATFTAGDPPQTAGTIGSTINLLVLGEYIRYSIQPLQLDPSSSTYTPSLVRDLIAYPGSVAASWASPISTSIIADNVSAFRVGLSADGGATWAGTTAAGAWSTSSSSFADITGPNLSPSAPTLNYQLATLNSGLTPAPTVAGAGTFWFRQFPVLVRMDITTRTATQRSEYTATGTTKAYRYQTRSLILNPRHFGLSY